jgi:hypothetical protein
MPDVEAAYVKGAQSEDYSWLVNNLDFIGGQGGFGITGCDHGGPITCAPGEIHDSWTVPAYSVDAYKAREVYGAHVARMVYRISRLLSQ